MDPRDTAYIHQLNAHRTLVLNADMQPLSWMPLSTWSWQEAVSAVLQERVIQLKRVKGRRRFRILWRRASLAI